MKKLLAILLCAALCAGLTPAVHAGQIEDSMKEAYEAYERLYVAYSDLAGATLFKNSYEGFRDLGLDKPDLDPTHFVTGQPSSYEGLFTQVGPELYTCYEEAAAVIIENANAQCEAIIEQARAEMNTAINNMCNNMMAGIAAYYW